MKKEIQFEELGKVNGGASTEGSAPAYAVGQTICGVYNGHNSRIIILEYLGQGNYQCKLYRQNSRLAPRQIIVDEATLKSIEAGGLSQ